MKKRHLTAGVLAALFFSLPVSAQSLPRIDRANAYVFDALIIPGRARDNIKIVNNTADENFTVCVYVYANIYAWVPAGNVLVKKTNGTFEVDTDIKLKDYQYFAVEAMNGKRYEYNVTKKSDDLYITVMPSSGGSASPMRSGDMTATSLDDAVISVAEHFAARITEGQKIGVLSISGRNINECDFVLEELSYRLVETRRFSVVDRRNLDTIRKEQKFQLSGEVSDDSAVSIGQLLGAEVVITGSISGTDSLRRLRVKAIEVKTGKIVAMESIRY